jgi:hypothetical protein
VNALFLFYDWNIWILAGIQWVAAGAFVYALYRRGAKRSNAAEFVGKYKEMGAPAS